MLAGDGITRISGIDSTFSHAYSSVQSTIDKQPYVNTDILVDFQCIIIDHVVKAGTRDGDITLRNCVLFAETVMVTEVVAVEITAVMPSPDMLLIPTVEGLMSTYV